MNLRIGDVVRIQPNHISFRSVTAIGDIHSAKASTKKGALYLHLFRAPRAPPSLLNIVYPDMLTYVWTQWQWEARFLEAYNWYLVQQYSHESIPRDSSKIFHKTHAGNWTDCNKKWWSRGYEWLVSSILVWCTIPWPSDSQVLMNRLSAFLLMDRVLKHWTGANNILVSKRFKDRFLSLDSSTIFHGQQSFSECFRLPRQWKIPV